MEAMEALHEDEGAAHHPPVADAAEDYGSSAAGAEGDADDAIELEAARGADAMYYGADVAAADAGQSAMHAAGVEVTRDDDEDDDDMERQAMQGSDALSYAREHDM